MENEGHLHFVCEKSYIQEIAVYIHYSRNLHLPLISSVQRLFLTANNPLLLCSLHGLGIHDIDTRLLEFNLANGACKPFMRPQEPRAGREEEYDTHSDRGVIQCLGRNRIQLWQAEDYGDKAHLSWC